MAGKTLLLGRWTKVKEEAKNLPSAAPFATESRHFLGKEFRIKSFWSYSWMNACQVHPCLLLIFFYKMGFLQCLLPWRETCIRNWMPMCVYKKNLECWCSLQTLLLDSKGRLNWKHPSCIMLSTTAILPVYVAFHENLKIYIVCVYARTHLFHYAADIACAGE